MQASTLGDQCDYEELAQVGPSSYWSRCACYERAYPTGSHRHEGGQWLCPYEGCVGNTTTVRGLQPPLITPVHLLPRLSRSQWVPSQPIHPLGVFFSLLLILRFLTAASSRLLSPSTPSHKPLSSPLEPSPQA